jgi:predicted NUDIX family NTP pyrophosphohydrolase
LAYAAKDAAGMVNYETSNAGGVGASQRKSAYTDGFAASTGVTVDGIRTRLVSERDTSARYVASFTRSVTTGEETTLTYKSVTFDLVKNTGWLISNGHMKNLFPEEA